MFADIVKGAQRGLLLRPLFGLMTTLELRNHDADTRRAVLALVRSLNQAVENAPQPSGLVAAFSPELWGRWHNREIPVSRRVLDHSPKLRNTGGDVFLFLKTPDAQQRLQPDPLAVS